MSITISWNFSADSPASRINIYRSQDANFAISESTLLTTLPGNVHTYEDTTAESGDYYYIVEIVRGSGRPRIATGRIHGMA